MASTPSSEKRAQPRQAVMRRGVVLDSAGHRSFGCLIVDLSIGGAKLQLFAPGLPNSGLSLIDRQAGRSHDLTIIWRQGPFLGVAFTGTAELP